MAIQSGCVDDHWIWLISPAAVYARIGSSIALGIDWISQIRAWQSSDAVHKWQLECGAHANPFTNALWLFKRATGVHGTRKSKIIICSFKTI